MLKSFLSSEKQINNFFNIQLARITTQCATTGQKPVFVNSMIRT